MSEKLFIFILIVFLALAPLAWASTPLNATSTNTSTPTDTTAPTATPAPTTAPPITVEPEEKLEILSLTVSPDTITRDGDSMDSQVKISASFSKNIAYTIEIWNTGGGYSYYLTSGEGSNVEIEWNGDYITGGPTSGVGLATAGTYKVLIYGKDESGNTVKDAAYVNVVGDETSISPTTPPPTATPSPVIVETEDTLTILDFWISRNELLKFEGKIQTITGIFASFSKKVKYTVEVWSRAEERSTTLMVAEGGNVAITWEGYFPVAMDESKGEVSSTTTSLEPAAPGIYEIRLYVVDETGEEIMESLELRIFESDDANFLGSPTPPPPTMEPEPMPYIEYIDIYPDAFSPNGDGVDDVMVISARASEEFEWTVYIKEDYGGGNLRKMWGEGEILKIEWDGLGDRGEKLSDYYIVNDIQTEMGEHQAYITISVVGELPYTLLSSAEGFEVCINEVMKDLTASVSKEEAEKICARTGTVIETTEVIQTLSPSISPEDMEDCIDYYQKSIGVSKEEAYNYCMIGIDALETTAMQMTLLPTSAHTSDFNIEDRSTAECFADLAREPGLSLEEVESICTSIDKNLPEYCAELEEQLINLAPEFVDASKEKEEAIQKKVDVIKRDMLPCMKRTEPPLHISVEPAVMNPCSEVFELVKIIEELEDERVYLKELVLAGEVVEGVLDDFDKKIGYLSGRRERMSVECKQGEETAIIMVDDSPCSKLASLTSIYKEYGEIQASSDGEEYRSVTAKIDSIAQEMSGLKEDCREADLSTEDVESFGDMETVYVTKLTASMEGTSSEELLESLQAIEEEKKRLIEEFTMNLEELEFKKTSIIKKLEIDGGQVSLDDVNVVIPTVKIEVEGVEVELKPSEGEVELVEGGVSVSSSMRMEYSNATLTALKSGGSIKVLPSELKELVSGEIGDVELVDEDVPMYIVKTSEDGKLLGVFTVKISKESQVNAEDGTILKETNPWWNFLVLG